MTIKNESKNMFDWTDDEIVSFAAELFNNGNPSLKEITENLQSMFKAMRKDFDKAKSKIEPIVVVGQVWRSKSLNVSAETTDLKEGGCIVVVWNDFLGRFEFKKDDFLAKFERVS